MKLFADPSAAAAIQAFRRTTGVACSAQFRK